ncbi:hypothetical protein ACFL40_05805 [candidate division KSB1 bacterium]
MLGGLVLFTTAVFITLRSNFNDSVVYWIFLPSVFGLIVTTLAGSFLLKYMRNQRKNSDCGNNKVTFVMEIASLRSQ